MEFITENELKELQKNKNKILVQYTASFCSPCKTLSPRLENISKNHEKIKFVKIDVQENVNLTQELNITSVPTVIVYDGIKIINRSVGIQSDGYYNDVLNSIDV
jgi:thioredoxin 1